MTFNFHSPAYQMREATLILYLILATISAFALGFTLAKVLL